MTVGEFEQKVWELDMIRVVIRADVGTQVNAFDWVNASKRNISLNEYCRLRLDTRLNGLSYAVIGADGLNPHGSKHISKIQDGYS